MMSVKTIGAEFNKFYNDPELWPDGVWHDAVKLNVNGETVDEWGDSLPDDATVKIIAGTVYDDRGDGKESLFEEYFKKWRKKQTTKTLIVECDIFKADQIMASIKAAGGKVKE
jgi:hypothetical protein